jgi:hypothetical protein
MAKETSLSITYAFRQESYTREETKQMPYVTTVERAGIEKGYRQGETDLLLWQIKNKFGVDSAEDLRDRIASAAGQRKPHHYHPGRQLLWCRVQANQLLIRWRSGVGQQLGANPYDRIYHGWRFSLT